MAFRCDLFVSALLFGTAQTLAQPASQSAPQPPFGEWAKTPPMGWNSYDAFGDTVVEAEVLANADYMRDHLRPSGWQYVVIDFRWYDPEPIGHDTELTRLRTGAKLSADAFGRLLPAVNRFPSSADGKGFAPLAEQVHGMGLKFGIHIMRGIPRQAVLAKTSIEGSTFNASDAGDIGNKCVWCPDMFGVRNNDAGQAWYDSIFRLYASWGVDFVKVDDLSVPYSAHEIEMIRLAIDKCGRPIVLSTSPGPTDVKHAEHIGQHANLWRISGDFWDEWKKLDAQFDLLSSWAGVGGPGHWPDADMIPFGRIAIRSKMGGDDHWTHFTRDEQRTLMSLWAIAPSPLMLGMNMPDNDEWTLGLLTNADVLAVNQDSLGAKAKRIKRVGRQEVWTKPLADEAVAIALFNRADEAADIEVDVEAATGLRSPLVARNLWTGADEMLDTTKLKRSVPAHGVLLLKFTAPKSEGREGEPK